MDKILPRLINKFTKTRFPIKLTHSKYYTLPAIILRLFI